MGNYPASAANAQCQPSTHMGGLWLGLATPLHMAL